MQRVLGLRAFTLDDGLVDPADRILHDRSSMARLAPVRAPPGLRLLYRVLHRSRRVVPFVTMARVVARVGRRVSPGAYGSLADIARTVHAVEQETGLADCYPRSLLTCYLCLRSARTCQLSLGTLAPTRKMHAWCTSDGELPYEALPEHYLYRPLLRLQFEPT